MMVHQTTPCRRNQDAVVGTIAKQQQLKVIVSDLLLIGLNGVFASTAQCSWGVDGLFVDGSPEHITKRQLIGELAAKCRMPTIYPFRSLVEAGGLMAYGIDLVEIFRQAARTIDQILKGAKPADCYWHPIRGRADMPRRCWKRRKWWSRPLAFAMRTMR
jgi:ABC transporter substrate binding protein